MSPLRPLIVALILGGLSNQPALADSAAQPLPYAQDWSNTSLISGSDDWSGVPGVLGYRGDDLTTATGTDPQTILGNSTVLDVNANQTSPGTYSTGGIAEFELADPTLALNGSGTADAPYLLLNLDTRGFEQIAVAYLLRDLDGSSDNAIQPVALQYRIGAAGNFNNVPAAFVADATSGPSLDSLVTPVSAVLPADAANQPLLQVRILTSNAAGNDEWVGVDDISVTGSPLAGGNLPIVASCTGLSLASGETGSVTLSASDADSRVNGALITSGATAGISLGTLAPALADGDSAKVDLDVSGLAAGSYPVEVSFSNDEGQTAACTLTVTVTGVTPIPAIQGSGDASPLAGQTVTTEGVVTKVIPSNYGYFIQDPTGDGLAETSDGIFVYSPGGIPAEVVEGSLIRLTASVSEYNTLTELTNPTAVTLLGAGQSLTPVAVTLPESVEGELERYEGMLVSIDAPLTVSQNYFQGRYGEITVSAQGRLEKPTNRYPAGSPEALALADDNARRRLTLDDGSNDQNPDPIPYMGADDTLRAGDTVHGVTGVLYHGAVSDSLRDYKLHPTIEPVITRDNPRSASPASVGGNLRVASFNVLNYFTTLDQSGAQCFPSLTRDDCRGADSAEEFTRQRDKIIAALAALDADVVGLMEIENNGETAVQNLVDGLNALLGAGTYASVGTPAGGAGSDAIRVAMIYKPGRLSLAGAPLSDTHSVHNRPPLAQTFAAANGEAFSVVVNHFKSKGSCPSDASDPNADQGDGQGCWNGLRVEQAQALADFAAGLSTSSGDADVLIIGDLNAYGQEDPVLALLDRGYADQTRRFDGFGYSYVFDGEAGYLDHALASASLAAQVTGTHHWHSNADEPSVIDYNTEYKTQDLYTASPYRASDHDPVLVGLSLVKRISGSAGRDVLVGTPGDDLLEGGAGADQLTGGPGTDTFVYASLRDGTDSITDFVPGSDHIDLTALLASLGISPEAALSGGFVRVANAAAGASVQVDSDGAAGRGGFRTLATLRGLTASQLDPARDLGL
ncbi:MAG: ExeM/NucH family extracellular endonuclease [Pseudomonadota bacterium]